MFFRMIGYGISLISKVEEAFERSYLEANGGLGKYDKLYKHLESGKVSVDTPIYEWPFSQAVAYGHSEYELTSEGIKEISFITDGVCYRKETENERILQEHEVKSAVLIALNELAADITEEGLSSISEAKPAEA